MTAEFTELEKRIDFITNVFESFLDPDPSMHSDPKSQDIIRAYILLSHAEFEHYFESIVRNASSNVNLIIDKNSSIIGKNQTTAIKNLLQTVNKAIDNNHGITWNNLKKLLPQMGFDMSVCDVVFISKLDNFTKKRGEIAHKGPPLLCRLLGFGPEKSDIKYLVNEIETTIDPYFVAF